MSCYPLAEMFTLMLQDAPHTTALLSYHVNTKNNTHDTSSGPVSDPSFTVRLEWYPGKETLRTIRTATFWLMTFQFLLLPVANSYAPIAQKSVLERLLGPIFAGNRHAPSSLYSLLVEFCLSRHWQRSVFQSCNLLVSVMVSFT
jgi:hypothetical protein